jgi:quinoprotein glucose dehydrogenase
MRFTAIALILGISLSAQDWSVYGGPGQTRYSSLKQITRQNVSRLRVAWTYDTADGSNASQTQPIVVNGVLYGLTPAHKVVALNAATGNLLWRYDSGIEGRGPNRGLVYWTDGEQQRIFTSVQSFIFALDAQTGKPITSFGNQGRIDLREGLGRDPAKQSIVLTSPGVIYKDLLIVGDRTPEALPAPPGDIRAYDVRTGRIRWTFHTIPHPGEFGYDTWPKDAWTYSGAANSWPGLAVDEKRGMVYVPTGSAATDFYGADRLGDNLFANSLIALNAETGERVWHFQAVKHDLWDRDFPSPPNLVTIKRGGKRVDAVAQVTKHGWVFVFDRTNGKPLFPLEEHSYPSSTVPGERSAKTQPLPTKPGPFARQRLTEDMLSNRTPEIHQWALNQFRTFRSEGQFVPLSAEKDTVVFPGFDGGAEWGGSAFDPETGLLYVNANDVAWLASLGENKVGKSVEQLYLTNCAGCHRDDMRGTPPEIPSLIDLRGKRRPDEIAALIRQGAGRMPSFPTLSRLDGVLIGEYVLVD